MDVTTHMFNPIEITESHKMTQQDALLEKLKAISGTVLVQGNEYFELTEDDLRELVKSALAEQDDEAVAYGIPHDENNNTFAYELLAMELAAEEHDDIHQLVYEGYPPEPWGEVWQRYEADAKKMIERVQKHTRHAQKTYTEQDIDEAIGSVDWANTSWQQAAVEAKKLVMRFVGSQVTMEPKRLSEEEVAEIMDNNGAGWWTKHNLEFDYHGFANALMDKMTGGGK